MKESKQERQTRNTELVETGNIAISLKRIQKVDAYGNGRKWKRSLIHAVQMTGECDFTVEKLRVALGLP